MWRVLIDPQTPLSYYLQSMTSEDFSGNQQCYSKMRCRRKCCILDNVFKNDWERKCSSQTKCSVFFFCENVTWSGLAELGPWGLPFSTVLKNSYQELSLTICIGPAPPAFQKAVIAHSLLYFASALPWGTNTSHFSEQSWSWENEAYCYLSLRGKRCLEIL